VLERHPQLLLLPSLPAASAAAAEVLASLSPRAAAAETAAAARAAVATQPYLILRLAPSAAPQRDTSDQQEPPLLPLPLVWEDLPMEVQNLMANEWDEWDDHDDKKAAFEKEWAGR
jgi:hypothetical protein